MTEKNVQIKDLTGNLVFPKTKAALVVNGNNENLGEVEAGAQVNKIEKIKVNGVELSIVSKAVDIAVPGYTLTKATTADSGYAATYQLFKDGVAIGDKINVPKDMVVSSGQVKYCETANTPVSGLAVGDPYIELTIANNDGTKIYIPVKDLVDVYTAGNGLTLSGNSFSVNTADTNTVDTTPTANSTKLVQSGGVHTALAGKQDTIDASHKLSADLLSAGSTNAVLTVAEKAALMTTLTYEELVSA